MMKSRIVAVLGILTCRFAAGAYGGRLSLQEHAAVQESLACVHPRVKVTA
jgi:hypothetical protein